MIRSRRRVGWWEFSARLFRPLCGRCGVVARISGWGRGVGWDGTATPVLIWDPTLPFKANAACRHHIEKQKRKVMKWAAYDASLRQRGSLTVWFTDEAITPGEPRAGNPRRAGLVFTAGDPDGADAEGRVPSRSAPDGGLDRLYHRPSRSHLAVPDHSALSRRAETLDLPQPRSSSSIGAEPVHLLVDSTGQSSAARVNGWSRNPARRRADPGGSCISAWTPARGRSSPAP
jgi:hypothetical protein